MEDVNKRRRISFSLLNLSAVLKKSTPGKFAYTCHFQQIGINATNIENKGIHFKPDVFAAVAVVDAKAPYCFCACESFGHCRGLCCEKRPPHSPHGFAVSLPKTLLMINNTPAGYPGHRAFFYVATDHICAQNLQLFKTSFVQYGMRVPLDRTRYIKDCLVLTCKFF